MPPIYLSGKGWGGGSPCIYICPGTYLSACSCSKGRHMPCCTLVATGQGHRHLHHWSSAAEPFPLPLTRSDKSFHSGLDGTCHTRQARPPRGRTSPADHTTTPPYSASCILHSSTSSPAAGHKNNAQQGGAVAAVAAVAAVPAAPQPNKPWPNEISPRPFPNLFTNKARLPRRPSLRPLFSSRLRR